MSYLTQAVGLTVQNFVSAAAGIAVLVALVRGFRRAGSPTIGNFWVDLIRATVSVLIPLATVVSLVLVSQGVVQTWRPAAATVGVESGAARTVALGPVASQVAIKQLGTNGGGFYNANSAHPTREPDTGDEPGRIALDSPAAGGALLHVRGLARGSAPRLGLLDRHGRHGRQGP